MKILLAGLYSYENFGDPLIVLCEKYLLESAAAQLGVPLQTEILDLSPASLDPPPSAEDESEPPVRWKEIARTILRRINGADRLAVRIRWNLPRGKKQRYRLFFESRMEGADGVVFAGGGLVKFRQDVLFYPISLIVNAAAKRNIPVYFNAAGVEGFARGDYRCRMLVRSLNAGNVRGVTTRDDFLLLKNCYRRRESLPISKIADPAVWASETLGIVRDRDASCIGVSVVRGKIFEDYGVAFDEERLLDLYEEIVALLSGGGWTWKLFCNGYREDDDTARRLAARLKERLALSKPPDVLRPGGPEEMARIIGMFRGIVGSRLHALITAYSLDVPAVGICWSDKMSMFGEAVGYPERILSPFQGAEEIVRRLEQAVAQGYEQEKKRLYRATARDAAIQIIRDMRDMREKTE